MRFGNCKPSSSSHTPGALAEFDRHVAAFLQTREGRRVLGWSLRKVCFSPRFAPEERAALRARGYDTLDLLDYARLF